MDGGQATFEHLPDEVLEYIFRALPVEDRTSCYDVCTRWREEITSNRRIWRNFVVNVHPTWNYHKTLTFFDQGDPELYHYVQEFSLTMDGNPQGQIFRGVTANAIVNEVVEFLEALPSDLQLKHFTCSGFKALGQYKMSSEKLMLGLCRFLRPQKRVLEEVRFISFDLHETFYIKELLASVISNVRKSMRVNLRRLDLTSMIAKDYPTRALVATTLTRFAHLQQLHITTEHLSIEMLKAITSESLPLSLIGLHSVGRLVDAGHKRPTNQEWLQATAVNTNLRVELHVVLDRPYHNSQDLDIHTLMQAMPLKGLSVDVYSQDTLDDKVQELLTVLSAQYPRYLTWFRWCSAESHVWAHERALVHLVNTCSGLATVSLENVALSPETATQITSFSNTPGRGNLKLGIYARK